MSAILGIFNLTGKHVAPEPLAKMMTAMKGWGPDGQGAWRNRNLGLGHLLLYNTPESRYEKQPMQSRCGRFVIIARARIDNREELLKAFDIQPPDHPSTPDSVLLLASYKKWGDACVNHILGDWIFAVWDKRKQQLFIARDHHGLTGLYYFADQNRFIFSSGLKGMLALPDIPRNLDELRLAQILVAWAQHGSATVYKQIKRLPPAHFMTIDQQGVKVKRYWYLEHTPAVRYPSDDDYVEAFTELYSEAVRCRLRSARKVGVTLSGGLDSGSVATLAAKELAKQGKQLLAFSSIPKYDVSDSLPKNRFDEPPFIRSTAANIENIKLHQVQSQHINPLQGLELGLLTHDEPVHAASNQYWIHALWVRAQQSGVGTMLTGAGGNNSISWNSAGYLAQLTRQFRWRTLMHEFRAWQTYHSLSVIQTVRQQIIRPLMPLSVLYGYRFIRGRKTPWASYSAINDAFVKRIRLLDQMSRNRHDPGFGMTANCRDNNLAGIKPGRNIMGCQLQQNGALYGMEVRDPTMDKRVLEFCFAIPDTQFVRHGVDRYLIRRAMAGLMPPDVLSATKRGLQATDLVMRLQEITAQIKNELNRVGESQLVKEILDVDKMHAVINQLDDSGKKASSALQPHIRSILLRGLMAGLFLHNYDCGRNRDER